MTYLSESQLLKNIFFPLNIHVFLNFASESLKKKKK